MGSHGAQGGDCLTCGLIATFTASPLSETVIRQTLRRMLRRGPDGEGLWQEDGVRLDHRRLAILDLDERAAHPQSACGRYVIVFNGEIFNFRDLRDALARQGVAFRTTSDTKVILALFTAEGEAMQPKLHGLFALRLALGQIESATYLRNQLLRDSDWASMDHSVELRTPLVDAHLLAPLQTVLPSFPRHQGKRLLAEAPENPLPRGSIERRKIGFGIPVGRWLAAESQTSTTTLDSRAWANRLVEAYDKGCM